MSGSNTKHGKKSRNFPVVSLKEAIEKAKVIYQKEKFSWTHQKVACDHLGLSIGGSRGRRMLSALIQYKLVETRGKGKDREFKLSGVAEQILHPDPSTSKAEAFETAVLGPVIFQELWEEYGAELPSDETMVFNLTKDGDFSETSARQMLETYKETVEYSGLTKGLTAQSKSSTLEDEGGDIPPVKTNGRPVQPPSATVVEPVAENERWPMPPMSMTSRKPFDLTLRLGKGVEGTLRLPNPMTPKEWETLKDSLLSKVDGIEAFLVDPTLGEEDADAGSADQPTETGG